MRGRLIDRADRQHRPELAHGRVGVVALQREPAERGVRLGVERIDRDDALVDRLERAGVGDAGLAQQRGEPPRRRRRC